MATSVKSADIDTVRSADRLLSIAMSLRCLIGLNLVWIGPLIPSIAAAQSASLAETGFLVSSYYVGAIPTMVSGRWFLSRLGVKGSLKLASLLMGLGLLIVALVQGMPLLWIGSLIFGLGSGLTVISGSVFALICGRDNPASLLNKLAMFYGFGALSGPLVAWLGCQTPWSYHIVYLVGAAYAFLIGLILMQENKGEGRFEIPREKAPGNAHLAMDVWMCALLLLLYIGVEIGATAWLYTYMTEACKLPAGASALGVSLLCAGLTFGRFIGIYLCRRFNLHFITVLFMLISTGSIFALAFYPAMGMVALLVSVCMGMGFGPVYPNILASISNKYPEEVDTVAPIVISTSFAGGVFMPFIIALVFEHVGLKEGMGIIGMTNVAVLLFYMVIRRIYLKTSGSQVVATR